MFEKQKMWVKEKGKKVKGWYDRNKLAIGFGAGCAAATGALMVLGKVLEPQSGFVDYNREEANDDHIIARVWYKNRFGGERQFMAIDYSDDDERDIRNVRDKLDKMLEIGD